MEAATLFRCIFGAFHICQVMVSSLLTACVQHSDFESLARLGPGEPTTSFVAKLRTKNDWDGKKVEGYMQVASTTLVL